jgi:hypothetical protein
MADPYWTDRNNLWGYLWVRLELDPPTNGILEPDMALYHEQYVDGHVLVKNWAGNERKEVKKNQMISWRVGGRHLWSSLKQRITQECPS